MIYLQEEDLKKAYNKYLSYYLKWEEDCAKNKSTDNAYELEERGEILNLIMSALYRLLALKGVTLSPEITKQGFRMESKASQQLSIDD